MTDCASIDLKHHFLIAMPGLEDETFARSVIYMCEHSPRGAMGLIINKPADISMRHLFDKVELPLRRDVRMQNPVGHGGPVQTERGFVLHDPLRMENPQEDVGSIYASTLSVPGGLEMTTSRDVLEAISTGSGPRKVLISLGYSAWGEGQLESELGENSWLTVEADTRLIFETPVPERYTQALKLLGLEPWMLASDAGHA